MHNSVVVGAASGSKEQLSPWLRKAENPRSWLKHKTWGEPSATQDNDIQERRAREACDSF